MNHGLKEPRELLFYVGGKYIATINSEGYAQSQLLLMDVLPSEEQLKKKSEIVLLASPPGQDYIDVQDGVPSRKDLIHKGWKVVKIGISRDRTVHTNGLTGKREQYSLKRKYLFSLMNYIVCY